MKAPACFTEETHPLYNMTPSSRESCATSPDAFTHNPCDALHPYSACMIKPQTRTSTFSGVLTGEAVAAWGPRLGFQPLDNTII